MKKLSNLEHHSEDISVIVTLNENSLSKIFNISKQLENLGLKVQNVLKFSGIITGQISDTCDLSILKIDGVKAVETDRIVKIA